VMRTARFVRGVVDALFEASVRSEDRALQVVYAGTGPFGPLGLLPLALSREIEQDWLFIDIHPCSLRQLETLIEHFGLRGQCAGCVAADASKLALGDATVDLVIVEVMQRSLAKEPQVAVMQALAPALRDDGCMLPRAIEVSLALADLGAEFDLEPKEEGAPLRPRVRQPLGRLLRVYRDGCHPGVEGAGDQRWQLGSYVVEELENPAMVPILRTRVEIQGEHCLDDYDSGLTVPEVLHDLSPLKIGDRLSAIYRMGVLPGVEVTRDVPSNRELR